MDTAFERVSVMTSRHLTNDRAPQAPLLGFVLGSGLAITLWGALGSLVWTVTH